MTDEPTTNVSGKIVRVYDVPLDVLADLQAMLTANESRSSLVSESEAIRDAALKWHAHVEAQRRLNAIS